MSLNSLNHSLEISRPHKLCLHILSSYPSHNTSPHNKLTSQLHTLRLQSSVVQFHPVGSKLKNMSSFNPKHIHPKPRNLKSTNLSLLSRSTHTSVLQFQAQKHQNDTPYAHRTYYSMSTYSQPIYSNSNLHANTVQVYEFYDYKPQILIFLIPQTSI